jgi:uncharacterized membrane protein YdjX (TVP38/TMEM64 family)
MSKRVKVLMFILIAELLGIAFQYREFLNLQSLAQQEATFRAYGASHPWLVVGLAFLLYVTVTAFSLPAAAAFTMGIAWLFKLMFGELQGFFIAVVMISFASTAGATLAFLMSRFLFRDAIQHKFGDRLKSFNEALEQEGALYLFTLRLIPAVPFFAINLVMGLTPIRVWTYWWVSQVGMLAGTAVYIYAGSQIPSLQVLADHGATGVLKPQILIAFILLGIFPIAVKKIMARVRPMKSRSNT